MKGQIDSKVLEYILIGVVALLILTSAFVLINRLRDSQREALLTELEEKIKSSIEVIASRVGSVSKGSHPVPGDLTDVCFVDKSQTPFLLKTPFVSKFPIIGDSLNSSSRDNAFLISEDKVTLSFYAGPVCFEDKPYYKCKTTPKSTLDVFYEGKGQCASIGVNWTGLISDNKRNEAKYLDEPAVQLFLVPTTSDNSNWQDILRISPLAFWKDKDQATHIHPFTTYHDTATFDDTDIQFIMDSHSVNTTVIFRNNPPNSYEITPQHMVTEESFNNYFSYWNDIKEVTVTSDSNQDGALITSLFAAYINTPVIFLNDTSCDTTYKPQIEGKIVNLVDENNLTSNALDCINSNAKEVNKYESATLRIAYLSASGFLELFSNPFPKGSS